MGSVAECKKQKHVNVLIYITCFYKSVTDSLHSSIQSVEYFLFYFLSQEEQNTKTAPFYALAYG